MSGVRLNAGRVALRARDERDGGEIRIMVQSDRGWAEIEVERGLFSLTLATGDRVECVVRGQSALAP